MLSEMDVSDWGVVVTWYTFFVVSATEIGVVPVDTAVVTVVVVDSLVSEAAADVSDSVGSVSEVSEEMTVSGTTAVNEADVVSEVTAVSEGRAVSETLSVTTGAGSVVTPMPSTA